MSYCNLQTASRSDVSLVSKGDEILAETRMNALFQGGGKPDVTNVVQQFVYLRAADVHCGESFQGVIRPKLGNQVAAADFAIYAWRGTSGKPDLVNEFINKGLCQGIPTYGFLPKTASRTVIPDVVNTKTFCSSDGQEFFIIPSGFNTRGGQYGLVIGQLHQNVGLIDVSRFRTRCTFLGYTNVVSETVQGPCSPIFGEYDAALPGPAVYVEFGFWFVVLGGLYLE